MAYNTSFCTNYNKIDQIGYTLAISPQNNPAYESKIYTDKNLKLLFLAQI